MLESLDRRRLLAVAVSFADDRLSITGDAGDNVVELAYQFPTTADGAIDAPDAVVVTLSHDAGSKQTFALDADTEVRVDLGDGADYFEATFHFVDGDTRALATAFDDEPFRPDDVDARPATIVGGAGDDSIFGAAFAD